MRHQGPEQRGDRPVVVVGTAGAVPIYWSVGERVSVGARRVPPRRWPDRGLPPPDGGSVHAVVTRSASGRANLLLGDAGADSTDALGSRIPVLRAPSLSSGCATRVWSGAAITDDVSRCGRVSVPRCSTERDRPGASPRRLKGADALAPGWRDPPRGVRLPIWSPPGRTLVPSRHAPRTSGTCYGGSLAGDPPAMTALLRTLVAHRAC